jgi:hypothetical protein
MVAGGEVQRLFPPGSWKQNVIAVAASRRLLSDTERASSQYRSDDFLGLIVGLTQHRQFNAIFFVAVAES